jgi:DNA (cytosine-5)-methyltransferase 3A
MNVLSLFDGMSCGQIALNRLGIKYNNYYAAEIDKYAIEVTKKNFPNTIHLGDVTKVKAADLEPIDLLMGGSPCQGFSFAGKQLNFDDPRSALFFEFVRLLKECKPQYFLLENVRMKKIYQDVITEHLGVEPIMINSSLLSAQNRLRLYWTNIPGVGQPQDKGLVLKDIVQTEHQEQTVKDTERNRRHYKEVDEKSLCMTSTMYKGAGNNGMTLVPIKNPERVQEKTNYWQMDVSGKGYGSQQDRIRKQEKPSNSLAAGSASIPKVMCGAFRGRYNEEGKTEQQLEIRKDEKTNSITTVQKDNVVTKDRMYYRKLTPIECERLQTVSDNYTQGVSNTQRYKMLGNGWTVDVIVHILKNINEKNSNTLQAS